MTARLQIRLKTVTGPWHNGLVSSPPILSASDDTIDFTCGRCGVVLMHAEDGQVHISRFFARNADRTTLRIRSRAAPLPEEEGVIRDPNPAPRFNPAR
jgi:hypothetical protein